MPQPLAPDLSGHCWTSIASTRCQWALPGLHRELQISVGITASQLRGQDVSGHRRMLSASPKSDSTRPDNNRELQVSVGPQPRVPNVSGHYRTSRAQPRAPDLSGDCGKLNDVSGHCRASRALPAASQLGAQDVSGTTPLARAPDLSGHCQTSTACASPAGP